MNRSMGGAGTAAPLDAVGAIHWNPASISGLDGRRVDLSVDLVANQNKVTSTLFEGTPMEISGTTHSHAGVAPLPAIGLVHREECSPWTYGLGLLGIGGFAVNYPSSVSNPVFTPPPPVGIGTGGGYSRLSVLQIAPTVAHDLGNGLSIGFAPTINVADAQLDPFPFVAPNDANGDGLPSYPGGIQSRPRWGLGLQAGLYYQSEFGIDFGLAVKSPQWFEEFEFQATDELGLPMNVATEIEYPLIITAGAASWITEDILLAMDVRYVDYENTPRFGDEARLAPDGSLMGLDWRSVIVVAGGVNWEMNDRLTVRTGYSYNPSPITESNVFLSIQAPAVYEHIYNLGMSFAVTSAIEFSATWVHAFENSVAGPIASPLGTVPLSRVTVSQAVDTAVLGVSVLY
ncbi:MAG: outer membrane protein transport protein [Planctomycetaceae bacterium]|nr:outer membrane protein transport protein [Planctomycetaceae bacterium]